MDPASSALVPPTLDFGVLLALARQHGFDDVKVTDASRHPEAGRLFREWLARGRHGDMQWLEQAPERRADPALHMDDARSILTFAVNYYREAPPPPPGAGRVARYAAGRDYHRVLDRALLGVIADLRRRDPTGRYRYYVDYGPVIERAFAERAGLGFVGRSAQLIHPRFGSYVLIATLITNAPCSPTPPTPGTCGQCRRCLDVCPTGALVSPYELDARLCISYLTIENEGPIPRHLRPLIGSWLFGCDLCQEVCPYNSKVPPGTHEPIAQAAVAGTALDVGEVLRIRTRPEFSRRFSRSPFRRAKRVGLLRNAAVVAGNLLHPPHVADLREALADESALVRGHAAWALGKFGEHACLQAHRRAESDPFVLAELDAAGA